MVRTQYPLPGSVAERSESSNLMIAGGNHTATNRWIQNRPHLDDFEDGCGMRAVIFRVVQGLGLGMGYLLVGLMALPRIGVSPAFLRLAKSRPLGGCSLAQRCGARLAWESPG